MIHTYKPRSFNLPEKIKGISKKQIEVHLGLYNGYVTHVNKLSEEIMHAAKSDGDHTYTMTELNRRLGFEFNGMRMHEYYFEQLEDGAQDLDTTNTFGAFITEKMGGMDGLIQGIKMTAMSRGIGWTILYWDERVQTPQIGWVSDHEIGTFAGLPILLALDMWEHAFMVDYTPAEKAKYIDAFFANTNWNVVNKRFENLK